MAAYTILLVSKTSIQKPIINSVTWADGIGDTFPEGLTQMCGKYPLIPRDYVLVAAINKANSWIGSQSVTRLFEKIFAELPLFPENWVPEAYCPMTVHPETLAKLLGKSMVATNTADKIKPKEGKVIAEVFINPDSFKAIDYMAAVRASCGKVKK